MESPETTRTRVNDSCRTFGRAAGRAGNGANQTRRKAGFLLTRTDPVEH